jgi:Flp pilus assembly secretin CpaC/tetratricopeptide (TPR) repeat protein
MRTALSLSLLLLLALSFVGCAKKKDTVEDGDGASTEAMAEEGAAEEGGEATQTPGEIADEAAADQAAQAELTNRLRNLADAKYKAGDLAEARDLYRRVLMLNPRDQAARDAYDKLSVELGDRAPVATEIVETEAARVEARRQETVAEINKRLSRARVAESEGDFDTAIRKYEEIANILNWYPYQGDFPVDDKTVRQLISRAEEQRRIAEARNRAKITKEVMQIEEARANAQKDEELRQMNLWLKMAGDAYERGEYDLAQANAQKVLDLDPNNKQAKKLIRIARDTKYNSDRLELREKFNDEWRTIMERLEYDAMPHPEVLNYPKNWGEISKRRPRATGTGMQTAPDPREEQILNVLETRRVRNVEFKAGEITLAGAVDYLRSVSGLNFVMSQKVKEEKAETEIDLKVDNVSIKQVLGLITEPYEMAWRIRNGVIMILGSDEAADKAVLQFYDVKDLVAKISDYPGQEINLVPSKYQPPEEAEEAEPQSPFEIDSLIDVIKQTIQPESWETIENADIQVKTGVLVVNTSPEVHRAIGKFLGDLRKNTGVLISLEVRFLLAEDRFLRDVGVDIRGLGDQTGGVGLPGLGGGTNFDDSFAGSVANPTGSPPGIIPEPSSIGTSTTPGLFYSDGADGEYKGRVENLFDFLLQFDRRGNAIASAQGQGFRGDNSGGLSFQHVFLDDTQVEVVLRAVEKNDRLEQISAPRLTVYDTQRANVSVMTQDSYVQDFDVEIAQAAAIGDPIVQTIRDGIIMDVRPIVSADRRFITMEMRPTVAELVRPFPTFQTSLANGPPVTIQVPEIAISRVRTTVTMPDGGSLMLGGVKFFRDLAAESGIPVLSKIPIISFLFSRKAKLIQRRNLLILVTANIVIPEEHAPTTGITR